MRPLKVIGLNSGTSMDGIDAALFLIEPKGEHVTAEKTPLLNIKMVSSLVYPFEPHFKENLLQLVALGRANLDDICRVNVALGEIFARAACELIKMSGIDPTGVNLIGSHGQTIWHCPQLKDMWGVPTTGTLQLGESAVIAARSGIPVISDFPVQDMAVGGQGAPLVAFADEVIFGQVGEPLAILNLGGIANITVIDDTGEAIMAFDTGPGNMILDRAAQVLYNQEWDAEGARAAKGKVDNKWLLEILEHPYFSKCPPKTTGREIFGQSYADGLIIEGQKHGLLSDDLMATLTALTALSICKAYNQFVFKHTCIKELILGGGGAENKTLVRFLGDFWPHKIEIKYHEEYGVSTKFKEALLFALLAYTTYFGIPNNVPRCTGASHRVCMGKICQP